MPYAPDWLTRQIPPPPRGSPTAIEALSGRSQFWMPKQFGPITRVPPALATSSSCSFAPSGPTSAKPPESTTIAATPLAAASAATAGTACAGTATTARSISPSTSRREAPEPTGTTSPGNDARFVASR